MKELIKEVLTNKDARETEALEALMLSKTSANTPWLDEPSM